MAKKSKKTPRVKAMKKGAAQRSAQSVNSDVRNALAQLETEKARVTQELEERRVKLLQQAISNKKEALSKAEADLAEMQSKVDALYSELNELLVQAGEKSGRGRPGRKPGRPAGKKAAKGARRGAGRKPRVSTETKQAVVANKLKSVTLPIAYARFRDELLKETDPASKAKIFSAPDFNSSMKFGEKYLPKGYKIQGERREAKIVKS